MKIFYPTMDFDKVEDIPFEKFKKEGIKGLMFDIDNTLTTHGSPASAKDKEFFENLRSLGFDTVLLSNNKEKRGKDFALAVGSKYIYKSGKPAKRSYLKALEMMNTNRENTVFVGDQIFTDIFGANVSGIRSVLVKPINKKEELQIVIKRIPEKLILYFYKKSKKKRLGYV